MAGVVTPREKLDWAAAAHGLCDACARVCSHRQRLLVGLDDRRGRIGGLARSVRYRGACHGIQRRRGHTPVDPVALSDLTGLHRRRQLGAVRIAGEKPRATPQRVCCLVQPASDRLTGRLGSRPTRRPPRRRVLGRDRGRRVLALPAPRRDRFRLLWRGRGVGLEPSVRSRGHLGRRSCTYRAFRLHGLREPGRARPES